MPPLRRRRRSTRHSTAAALYSRNDQSEVSGDRTASVSDDVLAYIFAKLSDLAAVVRCAATCLRWAGVVATRAAVISGSLPPLGRFFPDLAVGVFHQENDRPTARGQHTASSSARPCFVATASGARFLGGGQQHILSHDGELLDHSCPVASRNGRLVLELRHEGRRAADGLRFAVFNPMMQRDNNIILVPPLLSKGGKNKTTMRDYGCALLTGHDLRPPRCNSFFGLLLIYNRGGANSTVLRCYSSDTGCWGPEAQCIVKIPSFKIRHMGPAVVHRSVAFWALDQGLLGVRLDQIQIDNAAAASDIMHLVPFISPHYWPNNRLLGVSPDDRLFFMYLGVQAGPKNMIVLHFETLEEEGDDDDVMQKWIVHLQEDDIQRKKTIHHHTGIRLRWLGEKSGIVLFTREERSRDAGTFTFNLRDKVLNKVADDGHSWKNLLGYEIDMAAYLASLARHRP
uniref:Uncharacterized protein n=1 Tax=Avena sativa TaxID=4498 RepID=A0ACD5WKK7_AVESA